MTCLFSVQKRFFTVQSGRLHVSLLVKKTNKHTYLYLIHNEQQIVTVSTNSRVFKKLIRDALIKKDQYISTLSYLFTLALSQYGIQTIHVIQNNIYNGNMKGIIELLKKYGVSIK